MSGGDWVNGIADLAGNILGIGGSREQNKDAANAAADQEAFQERMSNSAHQREVTDLKAAGLNPVLSANAGASTPNGAQAPMVNSMAAMPQAGKDFANLMLLSERQKSEVDVLKAQKLNIDKDTLVKGKGALESDLYEQLMNKVKEGWNSFNATPEPKPSYQIHTPTNPKRYLMP